MQQRDDPQEKLNGSLRKADKLLAFSVSDKRWNEYYNATSCRIMYLEKFQKI